MVWFDFCLGRWQWERPAGASAADILLWKACTDFDRNWYVCSWLNFNGGISFRSKFSPIRRTSFFGTDCSRVALVAQIPTATAITRTWCSARIARASYTRTASFAGKTSFPTRRGRRTRARCVRRTSTVWTTPTTAASATKGSLSSTTYS